jgi:hypothetical protein
MKNVWITALARDDVRSSSVAATLKKYGMQAQGHVWLDEPDKAVARIVQDAMEAAHADAWLVLIDPQVLAKPSVRYGLSILHASLQSSRGAPLPLVCLWPTEAAPASVSLAALPPMLGDALVFGEHSAAWPAKLVAAAARPAVHRPLAALGGYRLAVWGNENIGQWLEIGSPGQTLAGFAFGVPAAAATAGEPEARIEFQAVGPRGALPQKTTLEYAQEGLQMRIGEREYLSWAVRNQITPDQSYFVRIRGTPETLLCMPYPDGDDVEATVCRLI